MSRKSDAVLDAIWEALEHWDAAERRVRDLRAITKANVHRRNRTPNGTHILAPRRDALARYLTDAALTAIREYESEDPAPAPPEFGIQTLEGSIPHPDPPA